MHEFSHAQDPILSRAVSRFNDPERMSLATRYAQDTRSLAEIPTADASRLRSWLRGGLDRGLLAEYRAWVVSAVLYAELRRSGLLPVTLLWFEDALGTVGDPSEPAERLALFRKLEARFEDPSEGLLATPFFQRAIQDVRSELRSSAKLPPLGDLERLLR